MTLAHTARLAACCVVLLLGLPGTAAGQQGDKALVGLPLDSAMALIGDTMTVAFIDSHVADAGSDTHDLVYATEMTQDGIALSWAYQKHTVPKLVGMTLDSARQRLAMVALGVEALPGASWVDLNRQKFMRLRLSGDTTRTIRSQRPTAGATVAGLPPMELAFGSGTPIGGLLPYVLGGLLLILLVVAALLVIPRLSRRPAPIELPPERERPRPSQDSLSAGHSEAPPNEPGQSRAAQASDTETASPASAPDGWETAIREVREETTRLAAALREELGAAAPPDPAVTELTGRVDELEKSSPAAKLDAIRRDLNTAVSDASSASNSARNLADRVDAIEQRVDSLQVPQAAVPAADIDGKVQRAVSAAVAGIQPTAAPGAAAAPIDVDAHIAPIRQELGELRQLVERLKAEVRDSGTVDLGQLATLARDQVLAVLKRDPATAAQTAPVPASSPAVAAAVQQTVKPPAPTRTWVPSDIKHVQCLAWFDQRAAGRSSTRRSPTPQAASVSVALEGVDVVLRGDAGGVLWLIELTGDTPGLYLYPDPAGNRVTEVEMCFDGARTLLDRSTRPQLRRPALCEEYGVGWRLLERGTIVPSVA